MNYDEKEQVLMRYVREILTGKPVKEFPIESLPLIKKKLIEIRDSSIQISKIKLAKQAIMDIIEAEKQYKKSVKENEKNYSETPTVKSSKLTKEDLDDLINQIVEGEEIDSIPIKQIPSLLKQIKKRIDSHSDLEEFESAQYYEDLRKLLSLKMRDAKRNDDKSQKQNSLLTKIENTERKLQIAQQNYQYELQNLEMETREQLEKIYQMNQDELNKFDQETEGPLPPFTKRFSSELQNLRETQRHLILCKRFRDAALVRDKLKEICEIELENITDRHLRQRESYRNQMIDLHNNRIQYALQRAETQRIEISDANNKVIDALRKEIEIYERKLDMLNTSKRLNKTEDPTTLSLFESAHTNSSIMPLSGNYSSGLSFSNFDNNEPDYTVKISKERQPLLARQLALREPFSLVFDRKDLSRIDVLEEPRWKTIDPRRSESETRFIINSATATPKSEKITSKGKRSLHSARVKKNNPFITYIKPKHYLESDDFIQLPSWLSNSLFDNDDHFSPIRANNRKRSKSLVKNSTKTINRKNVFESSSHISSDKESPYIQNKHESDDEYLKRNNKKKSNLSKKEQKVRSRFSQSLNLVANPEFQNKNKSKKTSKRRSSQQNKSGIYIGKNLLSTYSANEDKSYNNNNNTISTSKQVKVSELNDNNMSLMNRNLSAISSKTIDNIMNSNAFNLTTNINQNSYDNVKQRNHDFYKRNMFNNRKEKNVSTSIDADYKNNSNININSYRYRGTNHQNNSKNYSQERNDKTSISNLSKKRSASINIANQYNTINNQFELFTSNESNTNYDQNRNQKKKITNSNNSKTVSNRTSHKKISYSLSSSSDDLKTTNFVFNGFSYTQSVDKRRNKYFQTNKKAGVGKLIGKKSEFEEFCDSIPPSRYEQLGHKI